MPKTKVHLPEERPEQIYKDALSLRGSHPTPTTHRPQPTSLLALPELYHPAARFLPKLIVAVQKNFGKTTKSSQLSERHQPEQFRSDSWSFLQSCPSQPNVLRIARLTAAYCCEGPTPGQ